MPEIPFIHTIKTYNNHATRVEIGGERFYYSYDTLMAYETRQLRIRLASPSRTTTRDLQKMGANWFEVVPESLFLDMIKL